jgi:hypothetical protein
MCVYMSCTQLYLTLPLHFSSWDNITVKSKRNNYTSHSILCVTITRLHKNNRDSSAMITTTIRCPKEMVLPTWGLWLWFPEKSIIQQVFHFGCRQRVWGHRRVTRRSTIACWCSWCRRNCINCKSSINRRWRDFCRSNIVRSFHFKYTGFWNLCWIMDCCRIKNKVVGCYTLSIKKLDSI